MAKPLTAAVSPARLASGAQVIEVEETISSLSRLSAALGRELDALDVAQVPANWGEAPVTGRIRFDFVDAQSTAVMADVAAAVPVPQVCQRCLEVFHERLTVEARLAFVDDADVPEREGYENWELDEDVIRPVDVVDELLVMALPFVALHDDVSCQGETAATESVPAEPRRPFADLRAQMDAESDPEKPARE